MNDKSFTTDSGFELENAYQAQDVQANGEFPGEHPFTRGVYPTMYRGRLWTMRQYAGFGTAQETNARYRYLINQGQMGLSVAFDLPTQLGYDPDHALSEGEVGKSGVSIASIEDMRTLFDGIDLSKISTSMTINAPASILLPLYMAVAYEQGVSDERISGTTQNDILKEYIARKNYIFPPEFSMRLTTDVIMFCAERLPRWNPISISGYHMREAGSTAVQELAFTLSDAIAYVEAVLSRGGQVDKFAPQLSFFFSSDNHFLEEIAKFRAARRLWAKLMKERFGATHPNAMKLRFHTQTGGSTLTAQQPLNNVIRVTLQALAAVLGGTQSLHTNSFDEALALPTEDAVTLALRTQQIIAEESGAADTIDPVAGSYAIESLTDQIEASVIEEIEKIDGMGGMLTAIENGYVQREIANSAYQKQREMESGKREVVGVNKFVEDEKLDVQLLKIDDALQEKQVAQLEKLRKERNQDEWQKSMDELIQAANGDENLMPYILKAVQAKGTVGEICKQFTEQFGAYQEPSTF